MGFCLQKPIFPVKLYHKIKTNNNSHPKPITNNNTIMQQHHNSKKSLNTSTKIASKGRDHLPGRRRSPNDWKNTGTTTNGRSERRKNTGIGTTTNGGPEEEQAIIVNGWKRKTNTRIGRRRWISGWEEAEDEEVPYEQNAGNALYERLTWRFYSNRVKGILDFSPWVLDAPAKMLGAPSNTLNMVIQTLLGSA